MDKLLEKIALDLESAADYIENHENESMDKEEATKQEEAKEKESKKQAMIAPIKEKLAHIFSEEEVDERLKTASDDVIDMMNKSLDQKVSEDWGKVEEHKGGKGKYAGYTDPIEAFAMGD